MYANDPLLVTAAAIALHDRNIAKRSADELRAFVDESLSADGAEALRVKSMISVGSASTEIMKATSRYRADLIVMGTHGLTGTDRMLMGSTTLSVLQRTIVPVLAVPRLPTFSGAFPTEWPSKQVLGAIELDETSARDVDVAAELTRWFGTSLLLVHAISEIDAPAWLKRDLSAHDRIRVCQAQRQLDALALAARRRVATEARVICGRPADEIAALAARDGIDLVLTALRDRRGWFGSRRGAVSYHVLSHAVTPVLAHPPQWRPR